MPANIFDRLTGTSINLGSRDADATDVTNPQAYTLRLTINPESTELGASATVTVLLTRAGVGVADQRVLMFTSDQNVGNIPEDVYTTSDGTSVFQIIANSNGDATISARTIVGGLAIDSNSVILSVFAHDPPENYGATGYGRVQFTIESVLSNALYPRIQRLSHAEQIRKYPGDNGLRYAHHFANLPVTFIPKDFFKDKV